METIYATVVCHDYGDPILTLKVDFESRVISLYEKDKRLEFFSFSHLIKSMHIFPGYRILQRLSLCRLWERNQSHH